MRNAYRFSVVILKESENIVIWGSLEANMNVLMSFIHSFINGITALCWALASSSVS
jgi:hypothetical protein